MKTTDKNQLHHSEIQNQNPQNIFAYLITEDSMSPKIEKNDKVLVDVNKQILNDCIVVVKLKTGQQFIRRYRELPENRVMLYTENPNYEPLIFGQDEINTIARATGVYKDMLGEGE